MLTIVTWLWGNKYHGGYVDKLAAGVRRHLKQPYRFVIAKPFKDDEKLLKYPGCFVRLRMFSRDWQDYYAIDDRFVCLDLDLVVTGELDQVFDRPESFVILSGANSVNPCPFNGSVMMLRRGYHHEVWDDFSIEKVNEIPYHDFPDDQGWINHKLPNAATWACGMSGIYAFQKPGWPKGDALPSNAKIVAFPGKRDPSQFTHLDWIKDNWKE